MNFYKCEKKYSRAINRVVLQVGPQREPLRVCVGDASSPEKRQQSLDCLRNSLLFVPLISADEIHALNGAAVRTDDSNFN